MLPNTTEQWKNHDGKSVLVKCINATDPTNNMTDVNSTDTRNGTTFQVSLQGEQVQIYFFIFWTCFHSILLFMTDIDSTDAQNETSFQFSLQGEQDIFFSFFGLFF